MEKRSKIEMILAGACVAVIGTAAVATSTERSNMDISYAAASSSSTPQTANITEITSKVQESNDVTSSAETIQDFTTHNFTADLTFSAIPVAELCTDTELVFISDDPPLTVKVPVAGSFDTTKELRISGHITNVDDGMIVLSDCWVSDAFETDHVSTDKVIDIMEQPENSTSSSDSKPPNQTSTSHAQVVYISSSGKIHSKSNCSGMKSYTEMDLDDALTSGFTKCKKCF